MRRAAETGEPAREEALCPECRQKLGEQGGETSVQRQAMTGDTPEVSPEVESHINGSRGGGQPLPDGVRGSMESKFGQDFGGVRVHTGAGSAGAARSLNAQAFTTGQDIHFGAGQYRPGTPAGDKLLAHELTHTVQQTGNGRAQTKSDGDGASIQLAPSSASSILRQGDDDQPTPLQQLDEMLNRFDVPEEEVIALLAGLSPVDKATVLAGGYKERMAVTLNIGEMVQAVNHLNPPLAVKLEWVQAAAITTSAIDYDDIKSMVVAAPQTERDALKTPAWRDFFVAVCDNETIIEAMKDLHFDLITSLEWIHEEIDPSNLEYSTLKPLIVAAPQTERDALKTSAWRDFFVAVCDNETIIEAMKDLHFDLVTSLEWIHEEIDPSNLEYSTIKPLIVAAPQADRDRLKTPAWRDFFVGVCTNKTIAEAVDDLNFDLSTKLDWMIDEGTNYDLVKPRV
jgi:hypothetical protein